MAMCKAVVLAVAAVAALAQLAAAVVHPVGGTGATWDTSGDFNAWSAKQKFSPGDSLVFTYSSSHDVVEVSKAGYDACSAASAVATYTGGSTTVKLATSGKRYFICGKPGHCAAGMKLEVNVAAKATTAPAPAKSKPSVAPASAPAPAPEGSAVPATDELPNVSSPTAAPAPKSSGAASIGMVGAKAAVALAMGMALAFAM